MTRTLTMLLLALAVLAGACAADEGTEVEEAAEEAAADAEAAVEDAAADVEEAADDAAAAAEDAAADVEASVDGEATVAFGGIEDGATVTSPVTVEFVAENFTIEPAGDGTINEGAGHLHVMIDVGCVTPGETIPADDAHLHFGDGSTSAELELEPGEHTLCLQAGDGAHTALDLTDEITITVE